jgi:hypothetical protein
MPTSAPKVISDLVSPFIAHLFNQSVSMGQFPTSFKRTFITPIFKKAGLDLEDVNSYMPISNLSVLLKLMERLVAQRLSSYLESAGLLPLVQSGFWPSHSKRPF